MSQVKGFFILFCPPADSGPPAQTRSYLLRSGRHSTPLGCFLGYSTTTLEFPRNWHAEGKSRPIPPPPMGERISSGPSLSPTDRGQGSIQFSVYDQKANCAWMTAHPEVDGASTGQILPDAVVDRKSTRLN